MVLLSWILGIVGALGVTGAIAAFFLIPAVAIPIMQGFVSWLLKCKPCLYVLAVASLCFASGWYGRYEAVQECKADAIAAELRNREIDVANASKALSDETERANKIENDANDRQSKDAGYIKSLESRPACALDDSDLGGLPNDNAGTGGKKSPARAK